MKNTTTFIYKGTTNQLEELGFKKQIINRFNDYYIYSWSKPWHENHSIEVENNIIKVNSHNYDTTAMLMEMYKKNLVEITIRNKVLKSPSSLTKNELIKENEMLKEQIIDLENMVITY